ncbi:hypothetical protein IVB03_31435 [Bradyrhizobium sp. 168]|uniref:hypothetical protein n=1 Tax=Bradyrhizobium sp. 168 TaxID=2782639 RepID=UPI001FF77EB7|nr:hypothetical protein [Bradyrhizobium sp. 168]MCK1583954.1 hypothetical protein [Bradyrhizobium sp. 168]
MGIHGDGRQLSAVSDKRQHYLQRDIVKHGIRQQPLWPCVLVLQCFHPLGLEHLHASLLIVSCVADLLLAACRVPKPGLMRLQNRDGLAFRKDLALRALAYDKDQSMKRSRFSEEMGDSVPIA